MPVNPYIDFQTDHSNYRYPDRFRKFFGEHTNNADPMITGFGLVFFTALPPTLNNTENRRLLTALCTNVTAPSMSIATEEYSGRDGGKWRVPTTANMSSNEITMHFWELVGVPMYKFICSWVSLLRNPIYGYMTDVQWRQSQYKGKLTYCACTPDMVVQYANVYDGVMPLNMPSDSFNGSIDAQAKNEYDITFSYDHYPYTSTDIVSAAQNMVDSVLAEVDTVVQTKYTDNAAVVI